MSAIYGTRPGIPVTGRETVFAKEVFADEIKIKNDRQAEKYFLFIFEFHGFSLLNKIPGIPFP